MACHRCAACGEQPQLIALNPASELAGRPFTRPHLGHGPSHAGNPTQRPAGGLPSPRWCAIPVFRRGEDAVAPVGLRARRVRPPRRAGGEAGGPMPQHRRDGRCSEQVREWKLTRRSPWRTTAVGGARRRWNEWADESMRLLVFACECIVRPSMTALSRMGVDN